MFAQGNDSASREACRQFAGYYWREQVSLFHLRMFAPRYGVPDRTPDGLAAGTKDPWWKTAGLILAGILIAILALAIFFMDSNTRWRGGGRSGAQGKLYYGQVDGPANALALAFADIAKAQRGNPLYLAWSRSWLALIAAYPQPQVVWQAYGNQRPIVDQLGQKLTWPDGSVVHLVCQTAEEWRLFVAGRS
jgi:hypothetical protein